MAYKVTKCLLGVLLKEAKMSKAELSRITGISEGQIYDYIANRTGVMGLENARNIADSLRLSSPYDLYDWDSSSHE
ncbi:helix-turn-helix domain-containing protein [Paenibacillus sp. FSL R7-0128]|uniref:helix-turn-helix domain-containing protein n=1 Tax=Paenibacillus sp. FSL R7-0128 TaxID=2954529 RepID=UPI0040407B20